MSKIDIISGFLGAGKTTLIKKLIAEAYQNEKIVLIENEFGEIGIDGTFLKDSGVTINEMNSGCICCSLVGDFETSLKEVLDTYHPDRVIIEPSGVGKLSDVIKAVSTINSDEMELDNFITVVDAKKCRMYTKNFGEFYNNQVEHASLIVLSRSQDLTEFQLKECLDILKGLNDHSPIITTAWDKLNGLDIINACEVNIQEELLHEHCRTRLFAQDGSEKALNRCEVPALQRKELERTSKEQPCSLRTVGYGWVGICGVSCRKGLRWWKIKKGLFERMAFGLRKKGRFRGQ